MNEKNTANMFENAYVSIGKDMPEASNLTNIESEIGEIPLSVKELLNEVMKAKHNSDMDRLTQEIKESKIQHNLVEELRKEIRDMHAKILNVEQEKILLNSLISKIRDIGANVMIYQKTVDQITQEIKDSKTQPDLEELRKEIRDLHAKIWNIEQEKAMESRIQSDLVEELRKEIRDMHAKIGNVEQEKILLNSLTSKIGDIGANVMIYQKTVDQITQEIKDSKTQPDLVKEYFIQKGIKIMQENLGGIEKIPLLKHLR